MPLLVFGIMSFLNNSRFSPSSINGWEHAVSQIAYKHNNFTLNPIPCAFFINVNHNYRGQGVASQLINSFKSSIDNLSVGKLHIPLLLPTSNSFSFLQSKH